MKPRNIIEKCCDLPLKKIFNYPSSHNIYYYTFMGQYYDVLDYAILLSFVSLQAPFSLCNPPSSKVVSLCVLSIAPLFQSLLVRMSRTRLTCGELASHLSMSIHPITHLHHHPSISPWTLDAQRCHIMNLNHLLVYVGIYSLCLALIVFLYI